MNWRRIVMVAACGAGLAWIGAAMAQSPAPPRGATNYSHSWRPDEGADAGYVETSLTGNGTACTTPGGASCTVVMAATRFHDVNCFTIWVKTQGAATVDDVLIEASPDNTEWVELAANQFDTLASGSKKSITFCPATYPWLRVEARAASTSSIRVWHNGYRN